MINDFDELLAQAEVLEVSTMSIAAPYDSDTLKAIKLAEERGLIETILVGDKTRIREAAAEVGYKLNKAEVINIADDSEAALEAVRQVHIGNAAFVMKGLISSATILKAVLHQDFGLRTGQLLSYVAALDIPKSDRLLFMTDPAINIKPSLEEKVDIVQNSISMAHALGVKNPKVAALAAIEIENEKMPATLDAAALAKMNAEGKITGGIVDGPLAFDNAVSLKAKKRKGIKSEVAGRADIFLVPYIEVGNVLYKALTYYADTKIAGIVMGARTPVAMSSRADDHVNKLTSIALGKVVANY
ncbi:bifunctional enoyl-CoA hydratase/phosphate acetyltransferase [Selenihalanaerobacter shriftii]|uniref:bifunctional enoyl-CoA hydratase/phosphate acetyltransferase n=1 Tax=Selenihalanaerobacter shriftii TaxID=142842 RepID=UPI0009990BD2|nr:bifunctional enoyl-CoA hydratase/phosphate acetyltransferase [Selenihalanaerobacter shriftii]